MKIRLSSTTKSSSCSVPNNNNSHCNRRCRCIVWFLCVVSCVALVHGQDEMYDDDGGYAGGGDYGYNSNSNNNNNYIDPYGVPDYGDSATEATTSSYPEDVYQQHNNVDPYSQQTDPEADSLYADYAARQEMKELGASGGIGLGQCLVVSGISYFLGAKIHSARSVYKIKAKYQKEQKALYAQYYNDVYKLSEQNQELQLALEKLYDALQNTKEQHELEAVQRDYDEFKQPDLDGDDRISRTEFNMYVKNYLANYPGMEEADYPKFEDFDHDGDGYVSFKEYAKQMAIQTQEAERKQAAAMDDTTTAGNKKKLAAQQALKNLYK